MKTMIRLDKALRELIYEHNCVTVPSFGSFILRESQASANKFTGDIKPSGQTIFFNNAIVADDGILANYYKENLGISYSRALEYIQDDTDQISSGLRERKNFPFGNIGNFFLNAEGKVFFLPSGALNISKKTFGLNMFRVEELAAGSNKDILFLPHPDFLKKAAETADSGLQANGRNAEDVEILEPILAEETVVEIFETPPSVEQPVSIQEAIAAEEVSPATDYANEPETVDIPAVPVENTEVVPLAVEEIAVKKKRRFPRIAASIALISVAGACFLAAQIYFPDYAGFNQAALLRIEQEKKDAKVLERAKTNIIVSEDPEIELDDAHFMAEVIKNSENFLGELAKKPGIFYIVGGTYMGENIALNECWRWKKLGVDATFAKVVDSSMKKVLLGRFVREKDAEVFAGQLPKLDGKELKIQQLNIIYD